MARASLRELPFPRHLRGFVTPILGRSRKDTLFVGRLHCHCGSRSFALAFPGQTHLYRGRRVPCTAKIGGEYFFLVTATCVRCHSTQLGFDEDLHGWNGYVCRDATRAALPRPALHVWRCRTCRSSEHRAIVSVSSQGKRDFVEEAGPDFRPSRWQEGFESLSLDLTCQACGRLTESWIACEAM